MSVAEQLIYNLVGRFPAKKRSETNKISWVSRQTILVLVLFGRTPSVVLATSGTMEADPLPEKGISDKKGGGGGSNDGCGDGRHGHGFRSSPSGSWGNPEQLAVVPGKV